MANTYMTASAAVGTAAGYQNRASKISISGIDPGKTDPAIVSLEQGGASGTTVWSANVLYGHGIQMTIPNIQFDYVTIADAAVVIEFYKSHGFK
jgi:hypothetical protein